MEQESTKMSPYECVFGREARAVFHEDWLFFRRGIPETKFKELDQILQKIKKEHWQYVNRRKRNRVNFVDVLPGDHVRWFPEVIESKYKLRDET